MVSSLGLNSFFLFIEESIWTLVVKVRFGSVESEEPGLTHEKSVKLKVKVAMQQVGNRGKKKIRHKFHY